MHSLYLLMKVFKEEADNHLSTPLHGILRALCEVFGLSHLSQEMKYLLEDGYMTGEHSAWVEGLLREKCRSLRRDAVPLVDSFGIPDLLLRSTIGNYDGNVYETYFAHVNASRHQRLTDNGKPVYWDELVRPLLRTS